MFESYITIIAKWSVEKDRSICFQIWYILKYELVILIGCVIVTFDLNKLRKEHNDFSKEIGKRIKDSKGQDKCEVRIIQENE